MEEITLKTEFGHSYIILKNKVVDENGYLLKMLTNNKINGLLQCKELYEESDVFLCYEITYKKSIKKEYESSSLSFDEIYNLFQQFNTIMESANIYLLEQEFFVIDPEYMYFDLESGDISLLYVPYRGEETDPVISGIYGAGKYYKLADFLLEKVNHKDEHAVNIAYQFYKMSKEEFFSITTFINYVEKERILKDKENREAEPIKVESPIEMEEFKYEEKKKVCVWIMPICMGGAGILCMIFYLIFKSYNSYVFYLFLVSLILLILSIIKGVTNAIHKLIEKREAEFDMPQTQVTIEEYWNDNEETVYFDDKSQNLSMDIQLEWKENGFTKKYSMLQFPFVIGKLNGEADCLVNEASVSRLHARIFKKDNTIFIQDLNSTNGTSVNGVELNPGEEISVKRGDELLLGKLPFFVV